MTEDAGTAGATADAGKVEVAAEVASQDSGTAFEVAASGPIHVTWTFISCGDNPITVGVVDQTTGKGLAGPLTIPRRMSGYLNSAATTTFSCTPGDVVCWSASNGAMVCGACVDDAKPDVGC